MKTNFGKAVLLILGLSLLSCIFILIGETKDIRTRLLMTAFGIVIAALSGYWTYQLARKKLFTHAVVSMLSQVLAYGLVLFCIWVNSALYANNWESIHVLIIFAIVYAPTTLFTQKFILKK